jgi:[acyl-carrier-protein] S-malonyltransferase
MRIALFPGQGVPAAKVLEALPAGDDLVERASSMLGYDLRVKVEVSARRKGAPLPTLIAQPAIFTASLIAWEQARADGLEVDVMAGHSLGEYAALVAAGALSFDDALKVVAARAEAMEEAARLSPGGMAALLKLDLADAEDIAARAGAVVANDNAPGQVVVSGPEDALARCSALAKERGGRAVLLEVSGPFHSPAMAPAQPRLAAALERVELKGPRCGVVSNVSARPYRGPGEIKELLVRQVAERVRFRESLAWLFATGATAWVDLGPGAVVGALAERCFAATEVLADA